jgi:hypothetical protein
MIRASTAVRLMPMDAESTPPRPMPATVQRRFSVHGADEAPSRALLVEGASFEDAALYFAEHQHPQEDGEELALLVEDCETGERQCFRIDLETGDAGPCR